MALVTCAVIKGDLPIKISWKLNDKPVTSIEGINVMQTKKRVSQLTIDDVQAHHAGEYTCIASNKAGNTSFSSYLRVNGDLYFFLYLNCFFPNRYFQYHSRSYHFPITETWSPLSDLYLHLYVCFFSNLYISVASSTTSDRTICLWRSIRKLRRHGHHSMRRHQRRFPHNNNLEVEYTVRRRFSGCHCIPNQQKNKHFEYRVS